MDIKAQRLCAWSGPACVILFLAGFGLVAGFIPPPSPGAGAHEIGELYRADHLRILLGMIISMFGAAFTGPWVVAMTLQLKRIEGGLKSMSLLQFASGAVVVLEFEMCIMFWQVAAFRVDRSDESIQLLNDLAFIPFIGLASTGIVQCVATAAVILRDRRERPILPRWSAFYNIFVGLCFVPGSYNALFHSGPIAWNGVLSWYVAMAAFMSWYIVNSYVILTALRAQEREEAMSPALLTGS
ncbi:MAG TPA: hypothetical protein VL595_35200 [Pseudonocardia sp.]|jgi:hypothetical protein|nr:hypothetical protein [Pseudonocardia sp.]